MAAKEMSIKLLIDPESNRLIFAEASKDFVDFLIFLLSLPIATAINLLTNDSMLVGSIANIHTSVAHLEKTYLRPNVDKNTILNPVFFSSVSSIPLSIPQSSIISSGKLYICQDPNCETGVTNICNGASCPGCSRKMDEEIKSVPASDDPIIHREQVPEEGYVQEVVSYLISDDLSVTPISAMAMLSMMNKYNVSKFEEKKVEFGTEEALELFKTSFRSTTVLTDVFLRSKKRKQPETETQRAKITQVWVRNTVTSERINIRSSQTTLLPRLRQQLMQPKGFLPISNV